VRSGMWQLLSPASRQEHTPGAFDIPVPSRVWGRGGRDGERSRDRHCGLLLAQGAEEAVVFLASRTHLVGPGNPPPRASPRSIT